MPLYEYECPPCGRTHEVLRTIQEYRADAGCACPTCAQPMLRIYLPSYQRAGAAFKAIVIDERPDGSYSFPMAGDCQVADGAIRRELTTFAEVDRVMRRVNQRERLIADQKTEIDQRMLEHMESANRADLRNGFTYQDHEGKTRTAPPLHRMSPAMQAFARAAMAMNDARPGLRTRDAGVHLEIREFDQANREPHFDASTGWRRRHS